MQHRDLTCLALSRPLPAFHRLSLLAPPSFHPSSGLMPRPGTSALVRSYACSRSLGHQVSVRLKRREARDGYERRLPGLGMPRRNAGEEGSRGDLIVHFMVEDGGDGES